MGIKAINAALPSLIKTNIEKEAYDFYVAECLRIITENTAKLCKDGKFINVKFFDIIKKHEPRKEKTGEEVLVELTQKYGLKLV